MSSLVFDNIFGSLLELLTRVAISPILSEIAADILIAVIFYYWRLIASWDIR